MDTNIAYDKFCVWAKVLGSSKGICVFVVSAEEQNLAFDSQLSVSLKTKALHGSTINLANSSTNFMG